MELKHCFFLLRCALGLAALSKEDEEWLRRIDWTKVLRFAQKQALVGIIFEGIKRLPKELAPKGRLLLEWVAQSEAIRRQNIRLNKATADILTMVHARGHSGCILKGQGNALLYDNPHSRTPGDIDVWAGCQAPTAGSRKASSTSGTDCITRAELYELARSMADGDARRLDVSYYHIGLTINGVEVELHPTPAVLASPWHNHRLQRWLLANADTQFNNRVELPDNAGSVAVPTREFNLVYQLLHLYHHYFFEGIGLRQFVDYALLLVKAKASLHVPHAGEGPQVASEQPSTGETGADLALGGVLKHLGIYKFAGAVMYVLQEVVGLTDAQLLVPADKKRGRLLLHDILRGGNFGHHDHRFAHNAVGHNIQRLQRDWQNLRFYPCEALAEPWFRLWHWAWRKTH